MKAKLDENGVLTVSPETPVEAYALKMWAAKLPEGRGLVFGSGNLVINTKLEKPNG